MEEFDSDVTDSDDSADNVRKVNSDKVLSFD